jgi:SH3-like domain-containing protein
MTKTISLSLSFLLLFSSINFLFSEEKFLTLKYSKVNLRQGPSKDYPVKIFYKKKYLPVLVLDSSNNYRKIRDHENNSGWIHLSQLSNKKAALTNIDQIVVFKNSTIYSAPMAVLEKGRHCMILKCNNEWCKIKTNKYLGWVKKKYLWGNF